MIVGIILILGGKIWMWNDKMNDDRNKTGLYLYEKSFGAVY